MIEAETKVVKPAAGPETASCEPLISETTSPPMMPERDAKGIGNLLCTAPELYAALKSARELLSRIYLDDKFDYNHVALEIMNANAALAKAVGKG